MPFEQVGTTLLMLRREREAVATEVIELHQRLHEADIKLNRLNGAIASLELLLAPADEAADLPDPGIPEPVLPEDDPTDLLRKLEASVAARRTRQLEAPDSTTPDRLRRYIPAGGRRLRSKQMVFDLLEMTGPLTKDALRSAFFSYYGRENMEHFWRKPDSALNTAIERAVEEGIVLEVVSDKGVNTYTSGFSETIDSHAMYTASSTEEAG